MSHPAPHPLPPAARQGIAAVAAAPDLAAKLLFTGGIGTGKTTALTAVRTALRDAGRLVLTRPPRAGDAVDTAFVVDDAHVLSDDELGAFTEYVTDPAATVVLATLALTHRPALRALITALQRENPAVTLGPLPAADILDGASDETVRSVLAATAGLPFLVTAVAAASVPPEQAARFALVKRLRALDELTRDTLLITSLSNDLGADDVAAALHCSGSDAVHLVDRAHATGLNEPSYDSRFIRMLHDCLAQIAGTARHHEIETSLLGSQLELGALSAKLAVRMAEHGLRDDRLSEALTGYAMRVHGRPAGAARLYRAAAAAGSTAHSPRLADALALAGDCTAAAQMADELLGSDQPGDRAAAVRVAASVAMHDGSATAAADLFRWLGPQPDALVSASGVTAFLAAGDQVSARAALTGEYSGPPTSSARAARSLADGLLMSLDHPFPAVIARLSQSLTSDHLGGVTPDTSAALIALAALAGGDAVRARSVIGRAVRTQDADTSFFRHRHRLLLGWTRMQDGQLGTASADVAAVDASVGEAEALHRRDALWAAALRTGIARRAGDSGAMQKHWYAAMEVLAESSIDLFSLLPLGELWIAGARMRQLDRLQHALTVAFAMLDAVGRPALWSVPLHWAGVHAGILANSPAAVAPHGQALTAGTGAFARALAHAGRTWLRVLANQVEADEVTVATRALAQFGLTWDGTRLASQAALQTPDARVSQAMLQLARDLKQTAALDETVAFSPAAASTAPIPGATSTVPAPAAPTPARLSDREREVAELLLLGMPYRDIGSQLFISAKTVEHHVARIRRRIGAESRSEMISMLRAMLAAQA